jgi:benzoate-CoA ligase family protein
MFNACEYLLDRQIERGSGARTALTGVRGSLSYTQLHDQVCRVAAGLRDRGLQPEQRVLMLMADSPEFVIVYLAAMRIGAIPVPVSTMLKAPDLAVLLADSRARLLAITPEFASIAAAAASGLVEILDELPVGDRDESVYDTTEDSPAFWLYTSGTTGKPKAAMHRHGSVRVVCETYGTQVLGIGPDDRCLSAAKAFFAYGLGNSVLFPLSAGATSILEPAPSKPDTITTRARSFDATLFFAGPTFFANMLHAELPPDSLGAVRLATSAGERLPASLYERWTKHFGVDILDGIGMTEMLHIFLSNRPGQVRPGSTGEAVPGYELRILDSDGVAVPAGTAGTLFVRGESTATGYWSRYAASRQVFQGEWLRTGDTYVQDPSDGTYTCLGRTDDMLKPSGIWVSPTEVEERLLAHARVSNAVVVSALDADGLEKPVAFVITSGEVTEQELIAFSKVTLPSFKCPRRVIFTDSFPATATGKVRRVELRTLAATALEGV